MLTVIAFFVESLPDVPFDLGEIYSGLIPIDYANTSEALFFVFQPKLGEPVDEITIWLNVRVASNSGLELNKVS
jgi:carboxypeptidase D